MPLEIPKASIFPLCVDKVRNSLFCTAVNGLGNKDIIGGLVSMSNLGNDLAQGCIVPRKRQHDETYQFVVQVRPENLLSKQEPTEFAFYRSEIFSVVPETLPLTDRRFIEDGSHSVDK